MLRGATDRTGPPTRPSTLVTVADRPHRRPRDRRRPTSSRPSNLRRGERPTTRAWPTDLAARFENDLIGSWQLARRSGDPTAPQQAAFLIDANQSLLRRTTRRGARRLHDDDLAQAAHVGLLHALAVFATGRDAPFGPYAIHWIRKQQQRTIAAGDHAIAIPAHRLDESLFQVVPLDDDSRHAAVPDVAEGAALRVGVAQALDQLPTRARSVVTLRYGLADSQPRTLREVAAQLGISDYTVRADLKRAHQRLRPLLE